MRGERRDGRACRWPRRPRACALSMATAVLAAAVYGQAPLAPPAAPSAVSAPTSAPTTLAPLPAVVSPPSDKEGEAEEEPLVEMSSNSDFSVALMLLVGISFVMSTFYLVNHSDDDIRKAAWTIISQTLSIFSAVLLFSSMNSCVKFYLLGLQTADAVAAPALLLFVSFAHVLIWYLLLQFSLAFISGAVSMEEIRGKVDEEPTSPHRSGARILAYEEGSENTPSEQLVSKEDDEAAYVTASLAMRCWSVLLGHMTGFAAIFAFGSLQNILVERDEETEAVRATTSNLLFSASVIPLAVVFFRVFFCLFEKVRNGIALSDDGEIDKREKLWISMTVETENDALGLTISFLIVQVVRFRICGLLANEEGEVEALHRYSCLQALLLVVIGITIFSFHFVCSSYLRRLYQNLFSDVARDQFKVVCGMCFAWSYFFGLHYLVTIIMTDDEDHKTISSVGLAVAVSFFSYVLIWLLDAVADQARSRKDRECEHSIREFMRALGVLIGFAWEKSFDAAVLSVVARVTIMPPPITELVMSIGICLCVVPAWRWYILGTMQKLNIFDEEEIQDEISSEVSDSLGDVDFSEESESNGLISAASSGQRL